MFFYEFDRGKIGKHQPVGLFVKEIRSIHRGIERDRMPRRRMYVVRTGVSLISKIKLS